MTPKQFTIEFFFRQKCNTDTRRTKVSRYQASINVISPAFQLFEVSGISKLDKVRSEDRIDNCVITSYPYQKNETEKWKDASTLQPNALVSTIGAAIENCIYKAAFP
jgi:hypothetical protein